MAAPQENLLSPGHLIGTARNTFPKQREHILKKSVIKPPVMHADLSTLQSDQRLRVMHLQQHWQELKERELAAQQHNRQLLLQFDRAQDSLTEMLTLTAAMKTIRMEYERYLDESAPRWQQQLKEKTQAAQRKKMEYTKPCSKSTDDAVINSSSDAPLLSQGATTKKPQKIPTENSHYSQDGLPHLSPRPSSWQTYPPPRAPHPAHIPPSFLPPSFLPPAAFPHPFQLHHLASTPTPHPTLPGQHPPGWVPTQPDSSWAWTTGIFPGAEGLWGQRGVAQVVRGEGEMSRAANSKGDGGAESGSLSQELDIKPVRLSSGPAESSESSMESSQSRRKKRKKREKTGSSRRSSTDRERHSSQESSRSSSVIITAAVRTAQSSESDASSQKSTSTSRGQRHAGLAVGSLRAGKALKEKPPSSAEDSGSDDEESRSTVEESRSEEAEKQSPDEQSESCRGESGSQEEEHSGSPSIKMDHRGEDEIEQEENSSSGEQNEEEEVEAGDDSEEQDSQEDEEQEERDEEKEDSLKGEEAQEGNKEEKEDSEEDEEQEEGDENDEKEEEMEDEESEVERSGGLKDKDAVKMGQSSPSSEDEELDEDESEGGDDDMEDGEEEESEEEEEQAREKAEVAEERDSDDSIVSPQKKCGPVLSVPEEASDEEQSADDSDELSDGDIEHLLAPRERQEEPTKESRAEEKPTALTDVVEPFQVGTDKSAKTIHLSDAEEFDDFYD